MCERPVPPAEAPAPNVALPCGRETVTVCLPRAAAGRATVLASRPCPPLQDPDASLARALAEPIGTLSLASVARGRRSACVVVSDATRPVPNRVLLPPILRTLEAAGVPRDAVTVLIATGMHRPTEGRELLELVGPEIAGRYRIVNHDCRDRSALARVTEIEGAPVELNRGYLEAELKVLTGLIEPHRYAGFSGGGKSVLPGLASFETMTFLHSFALPDRPEVALGRVEGNPFRDHVDAVCAAAGVDFLVNAVLDRGRRITGLFAGDVREAFRAGCRVAAAHQLLSAERAADLVLTTGGGHPLDQTLYQATKGLSAVEAVLRPGGTLVLVAGCGEGLGGPGFCEVVRRSGTPAGFRARYGDPAAFTIDQWAAQAFFRSLEHAGRVLLFAPALSCEEVASVGLTKIDDLDAVVTGALNAGETVYLVPEGPYVSAGLGRGNEVPERLATPDEGEGTR
ncbi:MAG: nickel-dependent lactate racemase [Deltaproteobacteria bacterium]|nr:nickel-dependent lactate racemase [Deltaproteobacteria bacterium]